MGLSIRSVGRFIAKPFEKAGQGMKHFFTGPDYDDMAASANAQYQSTGQTSFGQPAPTGPIGASGGGIPSVGSRAGYQQGPSSTGIGTPGGNGGFISKVADWALPKNPDGSIDWMKAVEMGLAIGAGVEGYMQGKKADQLTDEAIAMARDDYNAKKPLRDAAMARLLAPRERPDLSELTDQDNPYRKKRSLPSVGRMAGGY